MPECRLPGFPVYIKSSGTCWGTKQARYKIALLFAEYNICPFFDCRYDFAFTGASCHQYIYIYTCVHLYTHARTGRSKGRATLNSDPELAPAHEAESYQAPLPKDVVVPVQVNAQAILIWCQKNSKDMRSVRYI